jgi:hypothetical protein
MKESLQKKGYAKFKKGISTEWVQKINEALPQIFEEHESLRRANNNPITSNGLAMNALIGNSIFFDFLQQLL